MKNCGCCKLDKLENEFSKKGNGLQSICKDCNKKKLKEYYENNKVSHRANIKKNKDILKIWFKKYKSKLKCSRCSEDHISALDFHHEDPTIKEFNIPRMITGGYSVSRIEEELSKCIVLCANCHRKEHYIE